jgi:hypothetical protein
MNEEKSHTVDKNSYVDAVQSWKLGDEEKPN